MQHSCIAKEYPVSSLIAITPEQPSTAERVSDVLSVAASLVSGFVLLLVGALAF